MGRIKRQVGLYAQGGTDSLFPVPVIADREPTANDKRFPLGQVWVNEPNASISILAQVANNAASWTDLGNAWVAVGSAAVRLTPATNGFSPDNNAIQAYVSTSGGAAGTSYIAIRGDLLVLSGNGTETMEGVHAVAATGATASIDNLYGSFNVSIQADASAIDLASVGSNSIVTIEETDAADQAQVTIAGAHNQLQFAAGAAIPTATNVGATVSSVFYDAASDNLSHGFIATRSGAGAGVEADAAFKVLNGAGAFEDWTYGLDLFTGDATEGYTSANIRLHSQSLIVSDIVAGRDIFDAASAVTWTFETASGEEFRIQDDAEVALFSIDNDTGDLTLVKGDVLVSGGDVDITGGDLDIQTAGRGLIIAEGADARMGVSTLVAGTVTVATTAVSSGSRVILTHQGLAASTAIGVLHLGTIVDSTSFVITALDVTDASTETGDVSIIHWLIIDPS